MSSREVTIRELENNHTPENLWGGYHRFSKAFQDFFHWLDWQSQLCPVLHCGSPVTERERGRLSACFFLGVSNIQASGRTTNLRDLQSNWHPQKGHFPEYGCVLNEIHLFANIFVTETFWVTEMHFYFISLQLYPNVSSTDVLIHTRINSTLRSSAFFHQTASGSFSFTENFSTTASVHLQRKEITRLSTGECLYIPVPQLLREHFAATQPLFFNVRRKVF